MRSWFSLPTMWIPGIEPRSSDYLAPNFEISVVYNGSASLCAQLLKGQAGQMAAPAALMGPRLKELCPQWEAEMTDLTAL